MSEAPPHHDLRCADCHLTSRRRAPSVPVTALAFVTLEHLSILLVGEGSWLRAYGGGNGSFNHLPNVHAKIFRSTSIYGICTGPVHINGLPTTYIIFYGGHEIRPARLSAAQTGCAEITETLRLDLDPPVVTDDWILCGLVLPLNHDSAYHAVWVTAQNTVVAAKGETKVGCRSMGWTVDKLASGPKSILYSADIILSSPDRLLIAAGTVFGEIIVWSLKIASTAHASTPQVHHVFKGHAGSVFGVCLTAESTSENVKERLLASCSDDRTIRLWPIEESQEMVLDLHTSSSLEPQNSTEPTKADRESGPSNRGTVWAHLSRIWGVVFLSPPKSQREKYPLVLSTGEDASAQLWQLETRSQANRKPQALDLRHISSDKYHSGKNIWSYAVSCNEDSLAIATGGADGRVVTRQASANCSSTGLLCNSRLTLSFADIDSAVCRDRPEPSTHRQVSAVRQYRLLSSDSVLCATDVGTILLGSLNPGSGSAAWSLLFESGKASSSLMVSSLVNPDSVYVATTKTLLRLRLTEAIQSRRLVELVDPLTSLCLAHTSQTSIGGSMYLVAGSLNRSLVNLIQVHEKEDYIRSSSRGIGLPDTFTVTSACYLKALDTLILGSRSGAVVLYSNILSRPESTLPHCFRHVHSSDSITCILALEERPSAHGGEVQYILTCGRDGTYAVHAISAGGADELELNLETVHVSSPPFGPNIEGAYVTTSEAAGTNTDLFLYGFRSTDFVVWNETTQMEVMSVDCGGAHRSWAYKPLSLENPNAGGSFIWTKAGSVHYFRKTRVEQVVLQEGGHGREIKALAVHKQEQEPKPMLSSGPTLIATGAEDTDIRLFTLHTSGTAICTEPFHCVRVLKKHTAGLLHLAFSKCGQWLFSSAGHEEFLVWRLYFDVPVVGIGVVPWDAMPKTRVDSDARITHFDLLSGSGDASVASDQTLRVRLSFAYSNGKVKVLRYTTGQRAKEGKFEFLHEIIVGDFCLTYACHLSLAIGYPAILSSSTQGYLHTSKFRSSAHASTTSPSRLTPQIHQSGIKALELISINANSHLVLTAGDDNAISISVLIPHHPVDTNADPQPAAKIPEPSGQRLQVLRIPSAHAAAVTALAVIHTSWITPPPKPPSHPPPPPQSQSREKTVFQALFASTSTDQRVKLWRVRLHVPIPSPPPPPTKPTPNAAQQQRPSITTDDIQIDRIRDCARWTDVADASGLAVLSACRRPAARSTGAIDRAGATEGDEEGDSGGNDGSRGDDTSSVVSTTTVTDLNVQVLVVGVGMEVVDITVPAHWLD